MPISSSCPASTPVRFAIDCARRPMPRRLAPRPRSTCCASRRGARGSGRSSRSDVLPPEARLEASISYTKGCYTGQEIVARLRSRGHVNHLLVGLRFPDGELPAVGAAVRAGDVAVGEITSAAVSPDAGAIALAFVRVGNEAPGTKLAVEGRVAQVRALPFVTPQGSAVLSDATSTRGGVLLVFAKEPRPGFVKTRMSPPLGAEVAAELYAHLLQDVLEAMASAAPTLGLEPVLVVHPPEAAAALAQRAPAPFRVIAQRGADLGSRMAARRGRGGRRRLRSHTHSRERQPRAHAARRSRMPWRCCGQRISWSARTVTVATTWWGFIDPLRVFSPTR